MDSSRDRSARGKSEMTQEENETSVYIYEDILRCRERGGVDDPRRLHAVGSSCLRDHDRSPPVTSGSGKPGDWSTRHGGRDGVDSQPRSREIKGKELSGRSGRTWISVRQSRGWLNNRLGGKISSLDRILSSNADEVGLERRKKRTGSQRENLLSRFGRRF